MQNKHLNLQIKNVIVYETKSESNLESYVSNLLTHCQEEADTLMILHAIYVVAERNSFDELIISSPDTDVLVLFIYFSTRSYATRQDF